MTEHIIKDNITEEQAKQVVSYLKKSTTVEQFEQLFNSINKVIKMIEEVFPEVKERNNESISKGNSTSAKEDSEV